MARRGLDRLRDRDPMAVDLDEIGRRLSSRRLTDEERDEAIEDMIRSAKAYRTAKAIGKAMGRGLEAFMARYGA